MVDQEKEPLKPCLELISAAATEKNPQKRAEISLRLSRLITQPNGLIDLFSAVIDFDSSSQKVTTHNQRFMAISDIISRLPNLYLPFEDYVSNISEQLKPLLISNNTLHSSLAVAVLKSILDCPRAKNCDIKTLLISPITNGVISCDSFYKPHESIMAIHNCIQNHVSFKFFVEIFSYLFAILDKLSESPSSLKNYVRASLISIINSLSPGSACCLLEKTLFHSELLFELYSIKISDEGVIVSLNSKEHIDDQDISIEQNSAIDTTLLILQETNNDLLILEFFFHFQETMWSAKEKKWQQISAKLIEPLLEDIFEDQPCFNVLTAIATNRDKSLNLVLRTLVNHTTFLRDATDDLCERQKFVEKSMISCLNIIDVLSIAVDTCNQNIFANKCLATLQEIDKLQNSQKITTILSSLINRLTGIFNDGNRIESDDRTDNSTDEYSTVVNDLNDELVPVRVHALVRLKQLVLTNDKYILNRAIELSDKIESTLADQEPYVFLASINLMSEMTIRRTKEILPRMIEHYARKDLELQHRINVGEVLVRVSRQLNETTPYYAQQVMDTFFRACQDELELIRMSSLTNIGEICKHLGKSLEKYIVEIMLCVKCVLGSDTIQVKCAAIDLMRNILMGLDSGLAIEPIQRDLKEIYGLLKQVKSRTLDDSLCLQADLALEEIRRLARRMLALDDEDSIAYREPTRPKSQSGDKIVAELVKNIQVLGVKK